MGALALYKKVGGYSFTTASSRSRSTLSLLHLIYLRHIFYRLSILYKAITMRLSALIASITLMAGTALAGTTFVHNKCGFDVYVTSVGATTSETMKLTNTSYWSEKQYFEGIGTAIKITTSPNALWESKPVLHFSYTYTKNVSIYYDLSTAFGFDFAGDKLRVHGPEGKNVEEIVWDGEPKPNHTAVFFGDTSLTLELCD
ncbi:hypothetical protein NX059_007917 [Plenodomus lindquistii]|nr:hypothetical protein NX059_007917 [Plenodomus lindquistii]